MPETYYDVIIIGAGPTGLACAIECKKNKLNALVIEKGSLVNSIYHFPANMLFFTTSDLLEIGDLPFTSPNLKPTREEGLIYYKRVAQHFDLKIHTQEEVLSVRREASVFKVTSRDRLGNSSDLQCRYVILATGYYDNPNLMNIPGENLSKVSHYYTDPHPFFDKDVLIVGGKNSACIAALELFRYGARVTMVHRQPEIKQSVKYWILPDFLNRVEEKVITLHLNSVVEEITQEAVRIRDVKSGAISSVQNDFVFAMTGYHPNADFMRSCGIDVDHNSLVPRHNPQTLETNVENFYVAGSMSAGNQTNKLFIENGRFHGKVIVENILKKNPRKPLRS